MAKKGKSQKALFDRGMPVTRITMKERKKLTNEIERTSTSLQEIPGDPREGRGLRAAVRL